MKRSLLAVLAGYATMSGLVAGSYFLLERLAPHAFHRDQARIDPPWGAVVIGLGFLWAVAGGAVTALLARSAPLGHVLGLAALCLALWYVYAALSPPEQSAAHPVGVLLAMLPGTLGGGGIVALRRRRAAGPDRP